jgi:hypothetical protein
VQDEALVDHDALRVAAERVAGRIRRRPVVGADHALLAELLQALVVAGAALAAAVDQAADADDIADLEAADRAADRADVADDLVARHAGIQACPPIPTRTVCRSEWQTPQ